jgi:hypothetical protein
MPIVLRMALLADLVSVWCEACFPNLAHTEIFSADHVARLMLLLLGAAILIETMEIVKGMVRKVRSVSAPSGEKESGE